MKNIRDKFFRTLVDSPQPGDAGSVETVDVLEMSLLSPGADAARFPGDKKILQWTHKFVTDVSRRTFLKREFPCQLTANFV